MPSELLRRIFPPKIEILLFTHRLLITYLCTESFLFGLAWLLDIIIFTVEEIQHKTPPDEPMMDSTNQKNNHHHPPPSIHHLQRVHFTSSDTHPTSGPAPEAEGSGRSKEFSLLNFSNILARKSLPDSTLSMAGSSSKRSTNPRPCRFGALVGVDGKLQKPGRIMEALGDPNPPGEPI